MAYHSQGSEGPHAGSVGLFMSLCRLFTAAGASQQGSPSVPESFSQPTGRGPSPLVRRSGVDESRARRRPVAGANYGNGRGNDPPGSPRTSGWAGDVPAGTNAPFGSGSAALEKKDPTLVTDLLRLVD